MANPIHDVSSSSLGIAADWLKAEAYGSFSQYPGAELHDDKDVLWYFTGLPHWDFNGVFRAQMKPETVDSKVEEMLELFTARSVPTSWRTGPATMPKNLGEHLRSHGLQFVGDAGGMAISLSRLRQDMLNPPEFTARCAWSSSALEDFMHVYAAASGDPDSYVGMFGKILKYLPSSGRPGWRHYVGYLNDTPVACSSVFLGDQIAGVFRVAVIPDVRGRGLGSAISVAPLLMARELGYEVAVLNPSDMSYGMYKRLGFQEHFKMSLYVWEPR